MKSSILWTPGGATKLQISFITATEGRCLEEEEKSTHIEKAKKRKENILQYQKHEMLQLTLPRYKGNKSSKSISRK